MQNLKSRLLKFFCFGKIFKIFYAGKFCGGVAEHTEIKKVPCEKGLNELRRQLSRKKTESVFW